MRDLVADDHSYSPKVEGLVLMFAEERRLQDSCWKNLSETEKKKITRHNETIWFTLFDLGWVLIHTSPWSGCETFRLCEEMRNISTLNKFWCVSHRCWGAWHLRAWHYIFPKTVNKYADWSDRLYWFRLYLSGFCWVSRRHSPQQRRWSTWGDKGFEVITESTFSVCCLQCFAHVISAVRVCVGGHVCVMVIVGSELTCLDPPVLWVSSGSCVLHTWGSPGCFQSSVPHWN